MTMKDDNLIQLPRSKGAFDNAPGPVEIREQIQALLDDAMPDAGTFPSPDPFADHRPNKLAIGVMTGLSVVGFLAAYLTPATADDGVKVGAAMAMISGIISLAGALLYRYGREFWIPRRGRRSAF